MNNLIDPQDRPRLIKPDYYTQLWFEDGELTAAVLQDDYTAWIDLVAGIEGSTLADANALTNKEDLKTLLDEWYLTEETAVLYYDAIETNDIEAATRLYPEFLDRGFSYIDITEKHKTSIPEVRGQARFLYLRETGDDNA